MKNVKIKKLLFQQKNKRNYKIYSFTLSGRYTIV